MIICSYKLNEFFKIDKSIKPFAQRLAYDYVHTDGEIILFMDPAKIC